MTVTILLLILILNDLATSQIPNPSQYSFTVTANGIAQERYAIDKLSGKMSRMWFSNEVDERFGGNQNIYVRDDGRNYIFNFMAYPPQCISVKGDGPYDSMNYWPNLVKSFGGENKTYDQLIFDADCDGTCLTWLIQNNGTFPRNRYQNRLYVKKAELKPIKMVANTYDIDTGKLLKTQVTRFTNWITGKLPEYEYDYPMDLETCLKP